ncbi:MAG: hypothetical protein ACXVA9_03880 [Bdellovibrionales bacterium]
MLFIHLLISFLYSSQASAYPEFIGYKYSSCLTCHYNGNGNGPLNDYGRALWSAEIAGRAFSGNKTEDQLGESSGFLGRTELPWWFRPAIKARDLYMRNNPGSSQAKTTNILMQADASVALFLDKDQKNTFVLEYGYAPQPQRIQSTAGATKLKTWTSREHYYRWQAKDSLFVYAGFLDKPYGIRIVDHTAYSRSKTGLAQNDQAHGVIAQFIQPKFEWSTMLFAGNLYQKSDVRQKGGSTLFEYEPLQAMRIGFSYLNSTNTYVANERVSLHSRTGLGNGSSILFETGLIKDTPKGGDSLQGYYMYAELMQRLTRGYHLFVDAQSYKDEIKAGHDDKVTGGFGLLMFPMARTEFRVELTSNRQFNDDANVSPESWTALAQLHISL